LTGLKGGPQFVNRRRAVYNPLIAGMDAMR
jgi:hypothetical protein